MDTLDKPRIRELAFRLYYMVNPKDNSYLNRNPKVAWRHLKPHMQDWWVELAETLDRTINSYANDKWTEPDIPEPEEEVEETLPEDDDPGPMAA